MKNHKFQSLQALLSGVILAVASSSSMALSTWGYDGTPPACTQNASNANSYGNSYNCTSTGAPTATLTAFSTTLDAAGQTSASGSYFDIANVKDWGSSNGYGVQNKVEGLSAGMGDHALDSKRGQDVMLLSFSSSVVLSKFQIGWSGYSYGNGWDADISLLRYDGSSPPPTLQGKTVSGLIADGWKLVNNFANVGTNQTLNTGATQGSSWWLLSGYNSAFPGYTGSTSSLDMGNDAFKLLSFAGDKEQTTNTTNVPEPGTMALAAFAAIGAFAARRRNKKAC